ncbi:MAG: SulP family inorganic anion transporter [Planctomycetes bacterium]|nr:SulP family inorganic anion transporter [Planctomycetota bacterium]
MTCLNVESGFSGSLSTRIPEWSGCDRARSGSFAWVPATPGVSDVSTVITTPNGPLASAAISSATAATEKPQNGIAGLKHWKFDLRSGLMVAMISLPFSMGIAITSGAPPVCGITSAIIAGFLLPFLGGSYVTISGPAAGLAPAIYTGIVMLGTAYVGNDAPRDEVMQAGYPLVLVAICLAGALQVALAKFKVARLSAIFPAAAIEGMLASIGLMIIVKQIPLLMGETFEAHEFWEIIAEIPHHVATMNWQVFGLGSACIVLLFLLASLPWRGLKLMPPAVWIFVIGTVVAQFCLNIGSQNLITIPESPLKHGIELPHFREALATPQTWLPLSYIMIMLLLIDGTESLATIMAVDKLDPFHRRSDPDRTLQAMGVSNVASSLMGGLTIIPGIVKSTANIMGGGRTQWANFYNACFLMLMLIFGRDLINMVPKAVLASILVFVGFKLCRPKVWKHVAEIGMEQFAIFSVTVLVTVTTDLLIGIIVGVCLKLLLNLWYVGLSHRLSSNQGRPVPAHHTRFFDLFRNPVGERSLNNGVYDLSLVRPLVCFNLFHVIRELQELPPETRTVRLRFTPLVSVVDHTTAETLFHYIREYDSKELKLELVNWEQFRPLSSHPSAIQLGLSGELFESEPPRVAPLQ